MIVILVVLGIVGSLVTVIYKTWKERAVINGFEKVTVGMNLQDVVKVMGSEEYLHDNREEHYTDNLPTPDAVCVMIWAGQPENFEVWFNEKRQVVCKRKNRY